MKKIIASALLLAGLSSAAFGQAALSDLVLGFRDIGAANPTVSLEVNLGTFSTFGNQAAGTTTTVTNIGAIGSSTFTSDWNTVNLLFGVAGTNGSAPTPGQRTLYAGSNATTVSPNGTASSVQWLRGSSGTQGTPAGKIQLMYNSAGTGAGSATVVSNVLSNSWNATESADPITAFGYFNPKTQFEQSSDFSSSSVRAVDLYSLPVGTAGTNGIYVGTFALRLNGDVTFTAAAGAAVPEPSTYAVILGAVVFGFVALRRRRALQA